MAGDSVFLRATLDAHADWVTAIAAPSMAADEGVADCFVTASRGAYSRAVCAPA